MPVKTIFIEIPLGHDFTVTVNEGEKVLLNNFYLLPSQLPPPDQNQLPQFPDPEFIIDEGLYHQDQMYPPDPLLAARRIRLRDHELLEIRFTPLRFNPRTRTVEATTQTTLDIELYPQSSRSSKGFSVPISLAATGFDQSYQGGIFSCIPQTRDLASDAAKTDPEIYMLIFADQFAASPKLKEFCAWKRQKGYRVVEVPTSKLPAAQRGAPSHKELVAYLRGLPQEEYPLYLLLIGDQRRDLGVEGMQFNSIKETPKNPKIISYSDQFMACRDDNDILPDLFHGRLPATNPAELEIMLGKLLKMDRDLPAKGPYGRILVAGQIQDTSVNGSNPVVRKADGVADRLFCETADAVACYFEKSGYQCVRALVNPGAIKANGRWNKRGLLWSGEEIGNRVVDNFISNQQAGQLVSDQINQGVALIQHRDHGFELGWGDPLWILPQVQKLKNTTFQPLFFQVTV